MIQVPVDISLEYLQFVLLLLERGGSKKKGVFLLIFCLTALLVALVLAGQVDLVDFGLIKRGMSEAEVLVRLGPPDYESIGGFPSNNLLFKSYF